MTGHPAVVQVDCGVKTWAGAPRFSVAGFAVVVAVVAVVSEVVVAVLSEVDVSVSVRINSVRVRLGSPSASVATETTTVLPDKSSTVVSSWACTLTAARTAKRSAAKWDLGANMAATRSWL